MKDSTKNISSNEKNEEINNEDIQKANESLDTVAYYLLEAIKRKSNQKSKKREHNYEKQ